MLVKKLQILALLTQRLEQHGVRPVLVGGTALELYTAGAYATADMDIVVADREVAIQALREMGFEPHGRHWFHPQREVAIEIPDTDLAGDYARLLEVEIADGEVVYCIGIEDLLVDRLNAAVHWQSSEDARWAKNLLRNHAMRLDWDYLWQRAREEGTAQVLEALWHEVQRHDETHEAE